MATIRLPDGTLQENPNSSIDEMIISDRRSPAGKPTGGNSANKSTRFSINAFRSELTHNGVLRNNRYHLFFTPPKNMLEDADVNSDTSLLTIRCESATVPGVNFFTTDNHRRYGLGPLERRPYIPQFNPITITFIVDRNARVVNYFNEWTNRIIGFDTSKGILDKNSRGFAPYQLDYKDNFISKQMILWVYDENGIGGENQQMAVKFFDVFPLATSDMILSWIGSDDILRFNVTLQYTDMQMFFPQANSSQVLSLKEIEDIESKSKTTRLGRAISDKIGGALLQVEETIVQKITSKF